MTNIQNQLFLFEASGHLSGNLTNQSAGLFIVLNERENALVCLNLWKAGGFLAYLFEKGIKGCLRA